MSMVCRESNSRLKTHGDMSRSLFLCIYSTLDFYLTAAYCMSPPACLFVSLCMCPLLKVFVHLCCCPLHLIFFNLFYSAFNGLFSELLSFCASKSRLIRMTMDGWIDMKNNTFLWFILLPLLGSSSLNLGLTVRALYFFKKELPHINNMHNC